MKIAVVASSETAGGAEQYLYRLYAELRKSYGIQPYLVGSLPHWPESLGPVIAAGITPKLTRREPMIRQGIRSVSSLRSTLRALDELGPDLVHVQYFKEKLMLPRILQRKGVPVVWTEHGPVPDSLPRAARTIYAWQAAVSKPIGISAGVTESLQRSGIAAVTVGNPFPDVASANSDGVNEKIRPTVLYAGRLHKFKRVHLVLEAAAALPHVDFIVAGTGPEASNLENQAASNVQLVGNLPNLDELYAKADVLVIASGSAAREGCPMVMLEARSRGIPVVMAKDCHAALEAVELGCELFEPTDAELVAAIGRALAGGRREVSDEARAERSTSHWARLHYGVMQEAVGR
ncbi:glycosyltransferase family 4 protein [Prescottella sp. D32]|uniref:glycosyltransferase family 4 protein n=1 Tax=Prescottella sp. D32 TaxID=3029740 RepID=UPI00307A68D2